MSKEDRNAIFQYFGICCFNDRDLCSSSLWDWLCSPFGSPFADLLHILQ